MKYLLLGRDAVGIPLLWYEFEGRRYSWPVEPPARLKEAIIDWNERMGAIIPTPEMHQPADLAAMLKALNEEGRALADRLNAEMRGEVEVRYLPEAE